MKFIGGQLLVCAVLRERILHHFKVYAEALQFNNAYIASFVFPDLSLFEFHWCVLDVLCGRVEICLLSSLCALHRTSGIFGAVELPVCE